MPDLDVRSATPQPPANLSDRARAEWERLAPLAFANGSLTEASAPMFAILASTLGTLGDAEESLARDGLLLATAAGTKKANRAVKIAETARREAVHLLARFGLQPAARF